MAVQTFEEVMGLVFTHEGGYVNHPKDPGGHTNLGITLKALSGFLGRKASVKELKNLSKARATEIYRRNYWQAIRGDELPAGVDYAMLDFAINSGPARAVKTLQKVLGVGQDGIIGDQTLLALRARAHENEVLLVKDLQAERLAFMKRLSTWKTFGKGWTTRVNEVQENAVRLALKDPTFGPVTAGAGATKAKESDVAFTKTPEGKALSVASLSAVGSFVADVSQTLTPMSETSMVIKYICLALSIVGLGIGMWIKLKQIKETTASPALEA